MKLATAKAEVKTDGSAPANGNGNTVSTQNELAMMSDNGMLYGLSVRALSDKFAYLHKAINGK